MLRRIVVCQALLASTMVASGCGPLAMLRPISALEGSANHELGLGTVAVSPRPYVDEPWAHSGQLWLTMKAMPWLQLSGISAFDDGALGVGIGATASVVRNRFFVMGVAAEGGYGWAAAGVPLAARFFGQNWVYGEPRFMSFGIYPAVSLPVGFSLHIDQGAFLRLEYQASWVQFQAYNLRHHLGAGFAVQW